MDLNPHDEADLRAAVAVLENPSLAARVANWLGKPFEIGIGLLPAPASKAIHDATGKALKAALRIAIQTLGRRGHRAALVPARERRSNLLHKMAVTATGAAGGALGLASAAMELPISTTIMLRSIADIARAEGEDITQVAGQLACIEVFALGGRSSGDDSTDTGYLATRAALARAVSEAARYIAERGLGEAGAPAIVRLISQVASRFSVSVSEKLAAQSVPAVGALGGATINWIFMDHFQNVARAHFTVRRLERTHGEAEIAQHYERLRQQHLRPDQL